MSRDAFFPGLVSVVRIVILWCSAFWLFTMTEYGEIYGVALGPFLLFTLPSLLLQTLTKFQILPITLHIRHKGGFFLVKVAL